MNITTFRRSALLLLVALPAYGATGPSPWPGSPIIATAGALIIAFVLTRGKNKP